MTNKIEEHMLPKKELHEMDHPSWEARASLRFNWISGELTKYI